MSGSEGQPWRFAWCPSGPYFAIDWDGILAAFPDIRALADCPQDPTFHAEGDVLTHTKMVCEALVADAAWRRISDERRNNLFAAALFHDVAKPRCARIIDGAISSPRHSIRGAQMTRVMLWKDMPRTHEVAVKREQIVSLVRHHGVPIWFLDRPDPIRTVIATSWKTNCAELAALATSDARGRCSDDREALIDACGLFGEAASEHECLEQPYRFESDHSRFVYFRRGGDPEREAYDDTRSEMVMMSGLPGAGKDHWLGTELPDWPLVSLDDIRDEFNVSPERSQGKVANVARERAREHLRRGRSFVWNATNTTAAMRQRLIRLADAYRARVRIVWVETTPSEIFRRNRLRSRPIPESVLQRLMDRIEVPDLTEAHTVEWHVT